MSLVNPEGLTAYAVYQHYCQHLKSLKPDAETDPRTPIKPKVETDSNALIKPKAKTDPTAAIKTAVFRYTLPGYGLPPNARKDEAIDFLKQLPIHEFQKALVVQQEVFDSLSVKGGIERTYRSALKKMLAWCSSQSWWSSAVSNSAIISQPRKRRRGSVDQVRVTKRKRQSNYSLTDQEISRASALQVKKKPPVFLKPFQPIFQQWLLTIAVHILESLDD